MAAATRESAEPRINFRNPPLAAAAATAAAVFTNENIKRKQ